VCKFSWGGKKLLALLHKRHPRWLGLARSTACDILSRHGMVPTRHQRRRIGHPGKPTTQILAPNDGWRPTTKAVGARLWRRLLGRPRMERYVTRTGAPSRGARRPAAGGRSC